MTEPRQMEPEPQLANGRRCALSQPHVPGLHGYYVLSVAAPGTGPSAAELDELTLLAHRVGRQLAADALGDPECYSVLYNAARTRRKPWPHFHILLAGSTSQKRRSFALLQLKHVLRWLGAVWTKRRWSPA
jgi:hypothetical protein